MSDPNQEAASAPAADESPTSGAPDTAAELHILEDKVAAIGAELTRHEQAETTAAAPKAPAPSLGRIVIVREPGKNDAPGIIAEVAEDTITCNVFRGDHLPHVATHLTRIDPESSAAGWFWPPRV